MKLSVILATICFASATVAQHPRPDSVVQPLAAASELLIPAAGSTPGANGTFFRSDIAIVNFASLDQIVKLRWLPQSGGSGSTTTITIPAHSGIRSADFVATYLNQTGLGAIVVSGVTSSGAADSSALLFVNSRIWTPQPGTSGTTSQSLPAIPTSTINTPAAALFAVGGADNPANYRENVGIVNLDPAQPQTFGVGLPGSSTGFTVVVAPMSMQQISIGSGLSPTQQVLIQNVTSRTSPATSPSNSWIAYGSTVDNVTGDAWSELAVVGTTAQ